MPCMIIKKGDNIMKHFNFSILIFLFLGAIISVNGYAKNPSMGDAYFDTATGHKYIKNSDHTYSEFARNGRLLKANVPGDQPHLVSSPKVVELDQDAYLVYEKFENNKTHVSILPSSAQHPDGWKSRQVLYSANTKGFKENIGLGYTTHAPSIRLIGKTVIATGQGYFDTATGHRYIKNSETTYAEYSRKGALLKTDVPNSQAHLVSSRRVVEISPDSYLLYEKADLTGTTQQILPSWASHPMKWQSRAVLYPVKTAQRP